MPCGRQSGWLPEGIDLPPMRQSISSSIHEARLRIQWVRAGARAISIIANVPRTKLSKECVVPDLIWIIVVVLVVLALLGYFGRGRFRG